jgi:uncharacterized protein YndB with AHSA1/START domain
MTPENDADGIVREIQIDADPETVFGFFTDEAKMRRWMAADATVEARPGGVIAQTHVDADRDPARGPIRMRGTFVAIEPHTRVVFTWGFENADFALDPGSTTVEVTLRPNDGGTHLRLVHTGLPETSVPGHGSGWIGMLERLAAVAEA